VKLDPYLSPVIKINSKWIKNLKERQKTMRLLDKNIGETVQDIGMGNDFFGQNPKCTGNRSKNKSIYIKLKIFCTTKEAITKLKGQPIEWEKISANYVHLTRGRHLEYIGNS
jgi:hypothetical protein